MTRNSLKVLFDTEVFGNQVHGGISRYYVELLKHLPSHGVTPILYAPLTINHYLRSGISSGFVGPRIPEMLRNRLTRMLARRVLAATDVLSASFVKFDVLHHTYYGRRLQVRTPRITTIVDMIPELHPELFNGRSPHFGKLRAAEAANVVIAISECTKRDIQRIYTTLTAPVEVVPLAVDSGYFSARASGNEGDVILYVGGRNGYKNFKTFADVTSKLLQLNVELSVLCVGGGKLSPEEMFPYLERGVSTRVRQRDVIDEELPMMYRQAKAFVFPSKYEGFGLPILEAFACKCPVVLSNTSCFPEVAGDAAEYFDPSSPDSMHESICRVVSDKMYRDQLRHRGSRRLESFSWDITAERTAAVYRRVTEGRT